MIAGDYSGRFASPIAQLKAAMDLLGQPGGHLRRPLLAVTDAETLKTIAQILREADLPVSAEREQAVIAERASW